MIIFITCGHVLRQSATTYVTRLARYGWKLEFEQIMATYRHEGVLVVYMFLFPSLVNAVMI